MNKLKLTTALFVTSMTTSAFAADFKLAVVDDARTSHAIASGNYSQALNVPQGNPEDNEQAFETSINQCAANIQLGKADEAISLCNLAITLIKDMPVVNKTKQRELSAYAHSNRGIAYSMKNDSAAALADFSMAYTIKKNTITMNNLKAAQDDFNQSRSRVAP